MQSKNIIKYHSLLHNFETFFYFFGTEVLQYNNYFIWWLAYFKTTLALENGLVITWFILHCVLGDNFTRLGLCYIGLKVYMFISYDYIVDLNFILVTIQLEENCLIIENGLKTEGYLYWKHKTIVMASLKMEEI